MSPIMPPTLFVAAEAAQPCRNRIPTNADTVGASAHPTVDARYEVGKVVHNSTAMGLRQRCKKKRAKRSSHNFDGHDVCPSDIVYRCTELR